MTDAFYRKAGVDALKEAPAVVARLNELRESALEHAGEDERPTLATQLEAQLGDALDGINRHMAEQHKAYGREVLAERRSCLRCHAAFPTKPTPGVMGSLQPRAMTPNPRL